MSKWISVEERLPEMTPTYKDGPLSVRVLVWNGSYATEACYEETFVRRKPRWKNARGYSMSPTHWMPLPEGPEK